MKRLITTIAMLILLGGVSVKATDGIWTNTAGDRLWSTVGNWTNGVIAEGIDSTASFIRTTGVTVTNDLSNLTNGNFFVTNANYTIAGSNITLATASGTSTFNVASSRTLTMSTALQGTNTLYMIGGGTLTLSVSNSYTGGTVINGGTLTLSANSSLGATNSTLTLNANTTLPNSINYGTRPVVLNNGAIFFGLGITSFTIGGPISGDGGFQVSNSGPQNGSGTFNLTSTNNTFTGPIYLSGGTYTPTVNLASIGDAPGAGVIGFVGGNSGIFRVTGGSSPMVLNYRKFQLGYNFHTPTIYNDNSSNANTLTVNSDIIVTATANLPFVLRGSNIGDNNFAGLITNGANSVISVTKTDGGKWILSGTNTYTGTTTISAGILGSTHSACFSDASTIDIGASGTLNLNFAGADTVTSFKLSGVMQVKGTWGSLASSAMNKTARITGTGLLQVGLPEYVVKIPLEQNRLYEQNKLYQ